MNWDQKALEAWLEESARKDEDALTLQKYTRADEGKVKVSNPVKHEWNLLQKTNKSMQNYCCQKRLIQEPIYP